MHSADWQVAGTIVAAIGVGGTLWLTWRGQRKEDRRAAPSVRWSLEHTTNDGFRLTNDGNTRAAGVNLTTHESLRPLTDIQGGPDLSPGEALTFVAAPDMGTTDMTITVTWTDEAGQPGRWRYPLPY